MVDSANAKKRLQSDGQSSSECDGTSGWLTNSGRPRTHRKPQKANQSDKTAEVISRNLLATGSVDTGIQLHHSPPDHLGVPPLALPAPDDVRFIGHAHLLATKWMNSRQLKAMVEHEGKGCTLRFPNLSCLTPTVGLIYRKGKFNILEQEQIDEAVESFRSVCAKCSTSPPKLLIFFTG
jgi:hypothetical protein